MRNLKRFFEVIFILLMICSFVSCDRFVITDNMQDMKNSIESLECVDKMTYEIDGTPNSSYCGFDIVVYLSGDYSVFDYGDTVFLRILQYFSSNSMIVTDIDRVGAVEYGIDFVDSNGNITHYASSMMPLSLSSVWSVRSGRCISITTGGYIEYPSDSSNALEDSVFVSWDETDFMM